MQHTPQYAGGGEAPQESPEDDAAIRMSTTTNTITDTDTNDDDTTKPSFGLRIRGFVDDSLRSRAVVVAFSVSVLISVSIGLTVGILPEMLTDRYARLYHGYGSDSDFDFDPDFDSSRDDDDNHDDNDDDAPPCWTFDRESMPEACASGADDAQTGSAWATFVQNLLIFFCNAAIGSYSDVHGRQILISWSVVLNGLAPCALLGMQRLPGLDPAWYYVSASATGAISYTALVFAALSDGCPEEYRAGRFATNMAGFYFGFAVAPTLALRLSHDAACVWSVALAAAALPLAAWGLPETLQGFAVAGPPSREEVGEEPESSESMTTTTTMTTITTTTPRAHESSSSSSSSRGTRTRTRITTATTTASTTAPGRALRTRCRDCGEPQGSTPLSLLRRPLDEMTILNREPILRLLAVASFLAAAVYSTDSSLVLFYIEDHLGVTERGIANMFVVMGLLGVILQGIGLQPLIYALGEHGLLLVSFVSGTIHNLLYGLARNAGTITVALSLSQVTKLGYPVLSSLCSQRVGPHEQGRVQGALLALNALGGAVGPVVLNRIYERTEQIDSDSDSDSDSDGNGGSPGWAWFGPGTMFVVASGLYFLGTIVVVVISCRDSSSSSSSSSSSTTDRDPRNEGSDETNPPAESSFFWENGDLEEPLLLQLGETSTI